MREQILYYAVKYEGEWKRIKRALDMQEAWERIAYDGYYVTIEDEHYPSCFKELEYAPWIVFYEGNLVLCEQRCCGIIGSRTAGMQGLALTAHITQLLKKRYVIVSGLAKGIDGEAHRNALDQYTIGVIGCGLDVTYPKENAVLYQQMRQHHLILSEYPAHTRPLAFHFPWRNRLIAALSEHIVVVEARKRSGTLLTVNEAITLDRDIWCVPYDFGKEEGAGCNLLISQGANILLDDEDLRSM